MEFTIQDKIDIYHVILGMIEADIQTWRINVWSTPSYDPNRVGVCKELAEAMSWYGLLSQRKRETFPEWYQFSPVMDSLNPHHPYWWSKGKTGDRQRCEHIRKVVRSLYKQLP